MKTEAICDDAANSLIAIRDSFRASTLPNQLVDQFWNVEDTTIRLLQAAVDCPEELFETLQTSYPRLIAGLIDVLETADRLRHTRNTAISKSCTATNQALIKIEYLKQRRALASI